MTRRRTISWNSRWFLQSLAYKLWAAVLRLVDVFRFLPVRMGRLSAHVERGVRAFARREFQRGLRIKLYRRVGRWWLELLFYLLDCLGAGEWYETLTDLVKFNTRPLEDWERELVREVFGNSIHLTRVRIDEYAVLGPRQGRFCYVSFFIINSWGPMQNSLLIHELVHVWQYQHLGMVYIPRALGAQWTGAGYDYGGAARLQQYREKGKTLTDFNYEQQADLVTDYYRIKCGYPPRWGDGSLSDLPTYEYFVRQLRAVSAG